MPTKTRAELYSSIGLHKQGKTQFYRELLQHMAVSDDQFEIAPGIKGMVMTVFTLPSYPYVFKIIKDKFAPQKDMTRQHVKNQYHRVKQHDRVGRMADTWEFSKVALPLDRVSQELQQELARVADSSIRFENDQLIINHCYIERRMIPLNLYLEDRAREAQQEAVLKEYGQAIRELAAANIFPGDMLLKNFGVTRHGRVIFYDYDEVCYLTECRFRHIPKSQGNDFQGGDTLSIGPNDIFPEEFGPFMFANKILRDMFMAQHPELFDPDYWLELQQAIIDGRVIDVYPYRNKQRFAGSIGQLVY